MPPSFHQKNYKNKTKFALHLLENVPSPLLLQIDASKRLNMHEGLSAN